MDPKNTDEIFDRALAQIEKTRKKSKPRQGRNPEGNPDFGSRVKRDRIFEDPLVKRVTIRLTKDQKKLLDQQPPGFARRAILKALGID